ncbi:DoxX family protein [Sinosporangium siamense]|uniref:DoxX-like family protein n=1 Tax=Sinosporangium siamense TaxID=1367973 RepID=A0A919RI11_9ACTN|nr:DoxX family protein [Sinosporangium siamense]GII94198.1 hypothetical protein Ssi02_44290 [Sinosporangium siamense]
MRHLGYPDYLAYVLGVWQAAAAVAIIVPGFPLIKEWAHVGCIFLWSGAVASHLMLGDGPNSWSVPLVFGMCAITSWSLRPADRRRSETRLRRDRPAGAGQDGAGRTEWRPRAWAATIGLLVVLYAVSFVTLPAAEAVMHGGSRERLDRRVARLGARHRHITVAVIAHGYLAVTAAHALRHGRSGARIGSTRRTGSRHTVRR